MGWMFHKRIRIWPGVYLNISKGGISLSFQRKGGSVNIGKKGPTASVGLPGTGLRYGFRLCRKKNLQ